MVVVVLEPPERIGWRSVDRHETDLEPRAGNCETGGDEHTDDVIDRVELGQLQLVGVRADATQP